MTSADPPGRDAFARLVEEYQGRIYGFVSRMCRNTEDAKDVLQDTFLSAFRAIGDFRGDAKLSTWLYRIAANACLKLRRRGKFEPERELSLDEFLPTAEGARRPEIADWSEDPEATYMREELQDALETAIADLPAPYRAVLVLRDVQGLPAEEVAEVLDLSVAAVKSRLHRARLYLRQRLAEHVRAR